jgi:hypothetical protein
VNQGTLFNINGQDHQVLVQHPVAEIQIREEVIKHIATVVKTLEESRFNILVESCGLAQEK